MSAFLPHQDPNPWQREEDLREAQKTYKYNHKYVSPLAMVNKVPFDDEFSFTWLKSCGENVRLCVKNHLELVGDPNHAEFYRKKHGFFGRCLEIGVELLGAIRVLMGNTIHFSRSLVDSGVKVRAMKSRFSNAIRFTERHLTKPRMASKFEDYANLFRAIGLPPVSEDCHDDRSFVDMRLAGPNPVMIQNVAALDDRFPVDEALYQSVLPGDSLAAAGQEGRLFLCDYQQLENVENGIYPHGPKYVYAPLALFAIEKKSRALVPVAIQCKQTPAADNPIFTPGDGYNWLLAKTIVEIADGNVHEAVTHMGRTHLMMEPFVVSTLRRLAPSHPLFKLLMPHFEGTLAINDAAWKHLLADKGGVDKLLGGTIASSRGLAVRGMRAIPFSEAALPRTFAARKVDATDRLTAYPFRDDALLYWHAIRQWAADYLALYYLTDADVVQDLELAAWYTEIGAEDGGRVAGVGRDGKLATRDDLIETITLILYTCSAQHAAVNFPQYDLMSYVPNMPLAGYAPAPTSKTGATIQDYLAMLPPLDMAELQMELGFMLGTIHYTTLGHYGANHFADPRVAEPLQKFQTHLEEIGRTIEQRNKERRRPYNFLVPSGVPQSINV